ncbi:MAG: hypothetical protein ACP5QA_14130 [Phycisphaerae bacterium]
MEIKIEHGDKVASRTPHRVVLLASAFALVVAFPNPLWHWQTGSMAAATSMREAPAIPSAPRRPKTARGGTLIISAPRTATADRRIDIGIMLINHGKQPIRTIRSRWSWMQFPQAWCWGSGRVPARFLREVGQGFRGDQYVGGSFMLTSVPPGRRYAFTPLNFSHIFDLSVPGKYKAQLAGMGMISNVIKFRVLPPNDKSNGPAIREFAAKLPAGFTWGNPRRGVQIGTYVKTNPGIADPIARVQILFRCAGKNAATISLVGNPHIDFAKRDMAGPFDTVIKAIEGNPVPLTAYGKLLANRHRKHPPAAKGYTLKPGVVYTYWRHLVLNREFDLSVYGPYRFSARLHGTGLESARTIIYVGVQSRFYTHFKMPE